MLQLASVHRYEWKTEGGSSAAGRSAEQIEADSKAFSVTINPMEIRTWRCFYHSLL